MRQANRRGSWPSFRWACRIIARRWDRESRFGQAVQASEGLITSARHQRLEPRQEPLLRFGSAPGGQIVLPDGIGQAGVAAEQAPRLALGKAGQRGGFEKGGTAIGGLDLLLDLSGKHRRQSEADVDGGE